MVNRSFLEYQRGILKGDIERLEAQLAQKQERLRQIETNLADPTLPKRREGEDCPVCGYPCLYH